jgi:hypothetical protein
MFGGGDGNSPLVDPWCMPCIPEKVIEFDSWCGKEWDHWCVGEFMELCSNETGIVCPEGAADKPESRLENPDRPVPPPLPSQTSNEKTRLQSIHDV